jgi:hypothetical protein
VLSYPGVIDGIINKHEGNIIITVIAHDDDKKKFLDHLEAHIAYGPSITLEYAKELPVDLRLKIVGRASEESVEAAVKSLFELKPGVLGKRLRLSDIIKVLSTVTGFESLVSNDFFVDTKTNEYPVLKNFEVTVIPEDDHR